jgi:hypothetical protein
MTAQRPDQASRKEDGGVMRNFGISILNKENQWRLSPFMGNFLAQIQMRLWKLGGSTLSQLLGAYPLCLEAMRLGIAR